MGGIQGMASPLVYHKTFNYGDCVLEKRAAAAAGINEKIFINTKGQISEGTVCNVFFVRKNMIYTPQLSCGLLPGILREYIMERFQVTETIIYPDELMYYEECFVTNSLMGVMPVRQLGKATDKMRGLHRLSSLDKLRMRISSTAGVRAWVLRSVPERRRIRTTC